MNFFETTIKYIKDAGIWVGSGAITLYQNLLSPLLYTSCRYDPSCSEYMKQAIEKFGLVKGVGMGLRRLSTCHPFHNKDITYKVYDPIEHK